MKRLMLMLILAVASQFASANQVGYRFTDAPLLDPSLPNIVDGEGAWFTISGSPYGSPDGYLTLTYTFLQPLHWAEFGFILEGASIIAGRVTASYSEETDTTIDDGNVHYFSGNAEDGDVRQISFYIPAFEGSDPADDWLRIVSIRTIVNDGTQVPEPGTVALFGIALLALARLRRPPGRR